MQKQETPCTAGRGLFAPKGAELAIDFRARTVCVYGRRAPFETWVPETVWPQLSDAGLTGDDGSVQVSIEDMPFEANGTLLIEVGPRDATPERVCLASFTDEADRHTALYLHRNGDLEASSMGGGFEIDTMTLRKALMPEEAGRVLFAFSPNVRSLAAAGRACMSEPRYGGSCRGALWLGSCGGKSPYLGGAIRKLACFGGAFDMPRMINLT